MKLMPTLVNALAVISALPKGVDIANAAPAAALIPNAALAGNTLGTAKTVQPRQKSPVSGDDGQSSRSHGDSLCLAVGAASSVIGGVGFGGIGHLMSREAVGVLSVVGAVASSFGGFLGCEEVVDKLHAARTASEAPTGP